MPQPRSPIASRPMRRMRGRRIQRGRTGVAAVIGTLLALLVFMTLFGLFLTQFLPLWMQDNEAMFANTVSQQLGEVKQCMDLLALYNIPGHTCATPITMESGGIPIFASPTQASLSYLQVAQLYMSVTFTYNPLNTPSVPNWNFNENFTPGEIIMHLPDRYYTPVTYTLSLGALIQSQGGPQQTILFQPSILATASGRSVALSMSLYGVYANSTALTSTGSDEIYVKYEGNTAFQSPSVPGVWMNFSTYYPCAWINFLRNSTAGTGISPTITPSICPAMSTFNQIYQMQVFFPPPTGSLLSYSLAIPSFSVQMGLTNPS